MDALYLGILATFWSSMQAIHPDCAIISQHIRAQELCNQTRWRENKNQTEPQEEGSLKTTECVGGYLDGEKKQEMLNQLLRLNCGVHEEQEQRKWAPLPTRALGSQVHFSPHYHAHGASPGRQRQGRDLERNQDSKGEPVLLGSTPDTRQRKKGAYTVCKVYAGLCWSVLICAVGLCRSMQVNAGLCWSVLIGAVGLCRSMLVCAVLIGAVGLCRSMLVSADLCCGPVQVYAGLCWSVLVSADWCCGAVQVYAGLCWSVLIGAVELCRSMLVCAGLCWSVLVSADWCCGPVQVYAGCRTEWDEIRCWLRADVGQVVNVSCSEVFQHFSSKQGYIYRNCTAAGWSDLYPPYEEACEFGDDAEPESETTYFSTLKQVYTAGYATSLISLITAIAVLASFRKFHCTRNYIHINLFTSFILRASAVFIKDTVLFSDESLDHCFMSTVACKSAVAFFQFSILANYFWLLVEGMYLQTLLALTFVSQRKYFWWYILIGWGVPSVVLVIWVLTRNLYDNRGCWDDTDNIGIWWIIKGPITASLFANIIIFLNVIRILVQKLKSPGVGGNDPGHFMTITPYRA
ncbi:hypothetical protein NFI96_034286 [Prochilodus magdalenae]|nr:hypothetical protein NFI96_034286 [Prochilodus magdalenae]